MPLSKVQNNMVRSLGLMSIVLCLETKQLTAATIADDKDDTVLRVIDAYKASMDDARKLREASAEAYNRWAHDWLQRLTTVASQDVQSPNVTAALTHAVTLANLLGEWSRSRQLITEIIARSTDDVAEQFRWLTELGEVAKLQAARTQNVEDRATSIEAFRTANSKSNEIVANPVQRTLIKEQVILNLAWIGEIYSSVRTDQSAQKSAAENFRQAREHLLVLVKESGPPQGRLAPTGFDVFWLAKAEAIALIRAEDYSAALSALRYQASLPQNKQPASSSIIEATMTQMPANRHGFEAFLGDWLGTGIVDELTPVVKYLLATSHYQDDEYSQARPIYEDLRDNYREPFAKIDGPAMINGDGGYYSIILYNLRQIYLKEGRIKDAAIVNALFVRMYPNYGKVVTEAKAVGKYLERKVDSTPKLDPVPASQRYFLIANVVVVILVFSLVAIRVFSRRRTNIP